MRPAPHAPRAAELHIRRRTSTSARRAQLWLPIALRRDEDRVRHAERHVPGMHRLERWSPYAAIDDEAAGRLRPDRDLAAPADRRVRRIGVARHDRDRVDRLAVDDDVDRVDVDPASPPAP